MKWMVLQCIRRKDCCSCGSSFQHSLSHCLRSFWLTRGYYAVVLVVLKWSWYLLEVVGAELLGRLCEVLCAPVCPVLHSLSCHWLQEGPCDLFQCQGLMEVPVLSRNALWHGWFRAETLPNGPLKRTAEAVLCRCVGRVSAGLPCLLQRQEKQHCELSVFPSPMFQLCAQKGSSPSILVSLLLQPGICSLPLCWQGSGQGQNPLGL